MNTQLFSLENQLISIANKCFKLSAEIAAIRSDLAEAREERQQRKFPKFRTFDVTLRVITNEADWGQQELHADLMKAHFNEGIEDLCTVFNLGSEGEDVSVLFVNEVV